jgi:hypothetical protein
MDMADRRAESALNATLEWRQAARAALDAMPRGSQERLSEAVGCSSGFITQLLGGEVDHSMYVGPISDWLGIPRPVQVAMAPDEAEVSTRYRRLTAEQRAAVLSLVRELDRVNAQN